MTPQSFSATLCPAAFRLVMDKVSKNPESTLIRLRQFWNQLRKVGPTSIVQGRPESDSSGVKDTVAVHYYRCYALRAMQKKHETKRN